MASVAIGRSLQRWSTCPFPKCSKIVGFIRTIVNWIVVGYSRNIGKTKSAHLRALEFSEAQTCVSDPLVAGKHGGIQFGFPEPLTGIFSLRASCINASYDPEKQKQEHI